MADERVDEMPDLHGRTYLVTGSNAGLGYFASEQLAYAGAHVIMSGRNPNRLSAALASIHRRVPGSSVEILLLDTSNLGSVRAAAATVRARKRIDGVLLNAGIVHPPKTREHTREGSELVLATNALGHFALAGELLVPLAAARGRMVWIGSMATMLWRYRMNDPQLRNDYSAWRAYVQSKIATSALGFEAARRLREANVPVGSLVAHPGYSVSGRTVRIAGVNEPSAGGRIGDILQTPITQSKERGAWPLVRALVDPGLSTGEFLGPRAIAKGQPRTARAPLALRSRQLGERLWRMAEESTHTEWPLRRSARRRPR